MTITDIVNKIYFLTKTNSSSYSAADMLIAINNAYERVCSLVIKADGRWQWDSSNQTDLPIATTALVSGQKDYTLATSHLKILRVECKDSSGNWTKLEPIDPEDLQHTAMDEFGSTDSIPMRYDKLGNSVFLYPSPNYSQAASLKIYFQRGPDNFTSAEVTTGTKVPGYNSLYHDLIPLWVAYDYCVANGLNTANKFLEEILRKEKALQDDYAMRGKDEQWNLKVGLEINDYK